MPWTNLPLPFSPADFIALAMLIAAWIGLGWRIENAAAKSASMTVLMAGFRREWMHQMVTRTPRIFDAQMLGHLRQGAAFFASATMLAIGGGLALVGNTEPLRRVARDLSGIEAPTSLWEIKLIVILLLISSAFLRYVWSHRLFGYTAVLISAVPNDPEDPSSMARADQAADMSILAARAFNRGMRTTYFALASCAWLLGAVPLMVAVGATIAMLLRREFASNARAALLALPPPGARNSAPTQM